MNGWVGIVGVYFHRVSLFVSFVSSLSTASVLEVCVDREIIYIEYLCSQRSFPAHLPFVLLSVATSSLLSFASP